MANEKLFYVGVKALIENTTGQILLFYSPGWAQQNIPPHWDIPGGRIDVGEEPLAALKREMLEETGIEDYDNPEFFTSTISSHITKHKEYGFEVGLAILVYKLKLPQDAKIEISDEHTKHKWADRKVAAKHLSNKYPSEFTNLL